MTEQIKVLVVDDNEDLLDTLSLILKRYGFNVATAYDGVSAVDAFQADDFDVTLMDVVMPHMNGVEAFQQIRQIDPDAAVILMTAYSDEELLRQALAEGVHEVAHKPIRIEGVVEMIKKASQGQPILVVDDDADILATLTKALEMEGHRTLTAASGEEAIRIVRETSCPIAFVDIKLPLMDGLETYLRLKEINPNTTAVMMTGFHNEVRDVLEKAEAAAAITCLFKPFNPEKAVEMVNLIKYKTQKSRYDETEEEPTGR